MIIKGLLILSTLFFFLNSLLLGWVFFSRLQLKYNDMGRYFDANLGVVYEQQAVGFYGFLTFVCVVLTLFFLFFTVKNFRGDPSV
jgi:hypothetical protein